MHSSSYWRLFCQSLDSEWRDLRPDSSFMSNIDGEGIARARSNQLVQLVSIAAAYEALTRLPLHDRARCKFSVTTMPRVVKVNCVPVVICLSNVKDPRYLVASNSGDISDRWTLVRPAMSSRTSYSLAVSNCWRTKSTRVDHCRKHWRCMHTSGTPSTSPVGL